MKKITVIFSLALLFSTQVWAGPGHDHGTPGDSAGGPLSEIVLTRSMIANLGIQSVPAALQDVAQTVDLLANIEYLPEKQAIVSARTEGTVAKILVWTGQKVEKGQNILVIQPRFLDNPLVKLTAPISGYVTEQNVVIGQAVSPDQPLVRIADISEVLVRGIAYENMAQSGFAIGQHVAITTPNFPGEIFEGTVHHVDATLRAKSRVREIDSVVLNPDGKLLANMQATLSVRVGTQTTALVVPQRAVLGDIGNYFVYVQESDHFYRRDVTLGQKFGTMREIIDGVLPDEHVVTVGNYQLQFVTPPRAAGAGDDHGHAH
ncbi:MAG: efflux RND transporter periplasmic adaptor subunit [Alphaproteobacteria bacterium]